MSPLLARAVEPIGLRRQEEHGHQVQEQLKEDRCLEGREGWEELLETGVSCSPSLSADWPDMHSSERKPPAYPFSLGI